ncbi:MAG: triose-phosphate isomerase [Hyphomonadaceae bacterium]|nr:triose-phosphate isomerase [Hyphomonadaceae bacterium]
MTPLIAGNWKMFGLKAALAELEALKGAPRGGTEALVCPPATLLAGAAATLAGSGIGVGGQDCHKAPEGAHTGDLSAGMLKDAGASYVILGHSERRRDHGESDALVRAKALAAAGAGLKPIVCVGETIEERNAGREGEVVRAQLAASLPDAAPGGLVIAYEPVWAIGTGLTPTNPQIEAMHALIHAALKARFGVGVRVLYGGSVKPSNAAEIFAVAGVDGALVGGASLKAADFSAIIKAHPAAAA